MRVFSSIIAKGNGKSNAAKRGAAQAAQDTHARGRAERRAPLGTHAVLIAGGGPTGLMLAGELALAGVDAAIVERRADQQLAGTRAGGMHARTLEVLDQRGIVERFVALGQRHPFVPFQVPLDLSDMPTRHNYTLGLAQNHSERLLAAWVEELGVPTYRCREVSGFVQDDGGVEVALSDGGTLRAQYLVGCDGGRSLIRKTAGIGFLGWEPSKSWLIAEAEMSETPPLGFRHDAIGTHGIGKLDDGPRLRIVLSERQLESGDTPAFDEVRAALVAVYGSDFGIHTATWISRFTDMTRQAAAYRAGRVLLAGDAAHVHPPVGGQGLNLGVQDAVNLGWKLAQVIKHRSTPELLDSYHAERHPVGARVLRHTMAQVALRHPDERSKALAELLTDLVGVDGARQRLAAQLCALDIRYDFGDGHPLLGRRMPDLDLVTAGGPLRVFTLLHGARPTLLNFGTARTFDVAGWADRVQAVDVRYDGAWQLPALGEVAAPGAVLIRPDGHVAWVGDAAGHGLAAALEKWFGAPTKT